MVDGEGGRLGAKRRGGRPECYAGFYFLNELRPLRTISDRMDGGIRGMWIADGLVHTRMDTVNWLEFGRRR